MRSRLPVPLLLAAFSLIQALPAQLVQKQALTLAAARAVLQAAQQEAERQHATVVIAVVDEGGYALVLERRDDTQVASVDVALAKARTAAIFRRPSREFEEQIGKGRLASLVLPGAAPLQGGVPLVVGGRCLGAIGVSGNTPLQDEQIALAGAAFAESLAAPGPRAEAPVAVDLVLHHLAPEFAELVGEAPRLERVATGFTFTEGPLWVDSALRFSEPNRNRIWEWREGGELRLFRERSGYGGDPVQGWRQPGSNGLALLADGGMLVCQHGNRRVVRLGADGREEVVCDRHQGRRLNSPNDVIVSRDGTVYFTDPVFGLPGFGDDPARELPFCGVYRVRDGVTTLVCDDLRGPNGIALSPDERTLYVGNWDVARKVVVRIALGQDGTFGRPETLLDLTRVSGETAIDGIEVDERGNLWVCGPGGVWVVAPDGRRLGRIGDRPEEPHNLEWGGPDGRTLFLTSLGSVYRLRLAVAGARAALR